MLSRIVITLVLVASGLVGASGSSSSALLGRDCGQKMVKSTGQPWQCTFADHFNGSRLNTNNWQVFETRSTGVGHDACLVGGPDTIAVERGLLHLTTRKVDEPLLCESPAGDYESQFITGGVLSGGKFSQTYGRFEFRSAFPDNRVQGVISALWMWPQYRKYGEHSGEIDVAEFFRGVRHECR